MNLWLIRTYHSYGALDFRLPANGKTLLHGQLDCDRLHLNPRWGRARTYRWKPSLVLRFLLKSRREPLVYIKDLMRLNYERIFRLRYPK